MDENLFERLSNIKLINKKGEQVSLIDVFEATKKQVEVSASKLSNNLESINMNDFLNSLKNQVNEKKEQVKEKIQDINDSINHCCSTLELMLETNCFKFDDMLIFETCVPGARKEDIEISLNDNVITINYTKFNPYINLPEERKQLEYEYKTYSREIELPKNFNEDEIEVVCSNGMLIIKVGLKQITNQNIDILFLD